MFSLQVAVKTRLDEAVGQIGKDVTAVQGDVSNLADLDRLYATVKEQKGQIDVLFANAGIGESCWLEKISETHFDKTFSVNVKGVLFTVQKALPLFKDGGSIILNGSIASSKVYRRKHCLQRNQGGRSLIRAHMDIRVEEPQDSCQRSQSRSN